ncbi:TetR family transcriptional regulator [Caballeronia udeis]|uniref:TetR family transcriptional regulator n=1 Tax=Caballeronia udeis TaxID=1232866 RepID=A0A158FIV8_9BURK|nr:TetR/AcrR family transcriptional regulator [Caballeronia udeis]SAL19764.1 TetR family transcriptional regulator [Caballeronia udeis]
MGFSQAQKAESRQRVLDVAARQIREHGLEALGVADCMCSAGLTHGAFYGHFSSREALIRAALEQALTKGQTRLRSRTVDAAEHAKTPLEAIADAYLNPTHADNPGTGCALCALAGDSVHATADVKALYTTYLRQLAGHLTQAAGSENQAVGLGVVATIVGAITLARAVDDRELALSILAAAHALVMTQDDAARRMD